MATKKKETKKTKTPGKAIGASGTNIFSGLINEEYNAELSDIKGIRIYDQMRKSDATVRAAVAACQLPIRRANWYIKTASKDTKDVEIRDFVEHALFDEMSITWDDFVRQALLELPFGVMVFEKVFTIREVEGVQRVVWDKFAPRLPKSITAWETADAQPGIQQLIPNIGTTVSIPMEKLLIFVNEMEGENWWGTSMLRSAYKHWYIKSNLEKIDSIAHERQGLGIPSIVLPEGHTDADVTAAENILKNLRASEKGYLLEHSGMSVEFKDMKATTTRDPSRSIAYHNRQIVLAVLAQFLDLGSGSTGSRALSSDQSDLFLQSLEAVANGIVDVINKYAIKELVDLNFDNVQVYPELDYNGISRVDVEQLSTAYQRFTQSGGLKPSEADDQHIRELLSLPERTEEDTADAPTADDKQVEDAADELGLSEHLGKKKISQQEVESAIGNKLAKMSVAGQIDLLGSNIERLKKIKNKPAIFSLVSEVLEARYYSLTWRQFQEKNDFKGWRKLTFAEKKVNLSGIQDQMDRLEKELTDKSRELLTQAKDDYIKKLTPLIDKKDVAGIKELEVKFTKEYTALLNDIMKEAYIFAKNNAAREMGVKAPASSADVLRSINIAADTVASRHAEEVVAEAKTVLSNKMAQGASTANIVGAIDAVIVSTIDAITRDTAAIVVSGHINLGRRTVFESNPAKIYALQRSEILDSHTCNYCLSVDERIIEKDDPMGKVGIFHSNCRGIWVEILVDEENKPKISGIPNSLRDRFGDAVNELVQPNNPIVKKNTPAAKQANKNEKKKSSELEMPSFVDRTGTPHFRSDKAELVKPYLT